MFDAKREEQRHMLRRLKASADQLTNIKEEEAEVQKNIEKYTKILQVCWSLSISLSCATRTLIFSLSLYIYSLHISRLDSGVRSYF